MRPYITHQNNPFGIWKEVASTNLAKSRGFTGQPLLTKSRSFIAQTILVVVIALRLLAPGAPVHQPGNDSVPALGPGNSVLSQPSHVYAADWLDDLIEMIRGGGGSGSDPAPGSGGGGTGTGSGGG
jgi:hypothetical protein